MPPAPPLPYQLFMRTARYAKRDVMQAANRARIYANMRGEAADVSFTVWQWLELCARCEYRCTYCGRRPSGVNQKEYLGMDHIIPLSRGGAHTIENVTPACPRCNASKADLMLIEWIAWKEGILTRRGRGARRNLRAA